jgi:hypothetical protein
MFREIKQRRLNRFGHRARSHRRAGNLIDIAAIARQLYALNIVGGFVAKILDPITLVDIDGIANTL